MDPTPIFVIIFSMFCSIFWIKMKCNLPLRLGNDIVEGSREDAFAGIGEFGRDLTCESAGGSPNPTSPL